MTIRRLLRRACGTVLAGVLLMPGLAAPSFGDSGSGSASRSMAAPSDCGIDVKSRRLHGKGYWTGARHLFIVHTGEDGARTGYRGGPSGGGGSSSSSSSSSSGSSSSGENVIVVTKGRYDEKFVDWGGPKETSRTVMTGSAACGKNSCFDREVGRINDTRTRYRSSGPNSNTVVSTMLRKCDVPREHPGGWTPGWDHEDL